MKKLFFTAIAILYVIIVFSCASRNRSGYIPVPDRDYLEPEVYIDIGNITETRDGYFPGWLFTYIYGGSKEVEKIYSYNNKYTFVGISEGVNFNALNRWAENFSAELDFAILVASRIERRLISAASLYPDDEYGVFFEKMVKSAYSAKYPGAVKEDTYWVKTKTGNGEHASSEEHGSSSDFYVFFVLVSIDRREMQSIISNMISETVSAVTPTNAQRNAINRLRQNFFEGF